MNELIIIGILLVIFTILAWADRKLTQIHAARMAYKRAKKIKF